MKKEPGNVLGRGLDSLLGGMSDLDEENATTREIAIDLIDNDPNQPRNVFDEESLDELAQSIRTHGIMQPLILMQEGDRYRIIAGERRFRAARKAGLRLLPAILRNVDQKDALELTLIENLQREDLNPMEQAAGLNRLMKEHGLTQAQVSERVGMSRSTIANLTRLLRLPKPVADMVADGRLTAGHAKVLLSLNDDDLIQTVAQTVASQQVSVRETEMLVEQAQNSASADSADTEAATEPQKPARKRSPFAEAQAQLTEALGTKVRIEGTTDRGRIMIEYESREQLEEFFERLRGQGMEG